MPTTGHASKTAEVLGRGPSAGVAAAVVREGSLVWFLGHGVADIETRTPITRDSVFRTGSITKTFTAIAVMQLGERRLVDLDAPASEYLPLVLAGPFDAVFPADGAPSAHALTALRPDDGTSSYERHGAPRHAVITRLARRRPGSSSPARDAWSSAHRPGSRKARSSE